MVEDTTAFVTASDIKYFPKAELTISELRNAGQWKGDIVLIAIDFEPSIDFLNKYKVILHKVTHIDTSYLVEQITKFPLGGSNDNRHLGKLHQWDKLYVFTEYFRKWKRIVFVDAGLRTFDSVDRLVELPCDGCLMAPDDNGPYDKNNRFDCQVRYNANPEAAKRLFTDFSPEILNEHYFLNCIFMFDTALLDLVTFEEMVEAMNKYPICGTNEMTIMNLFFTFKLGVWVEMPQKLRGKYLFGWSELNYRERPTWRDFCFIKYSVTG